MRNLLKVTLFLFLGLSSLNAQKKIVWFDFGIKAQGGASALYNGAIAGGEEYDYKLGLTSGFGYGARLGINFGYNGLSIEGMFNKGKQDFENNILNNAIETVNWKSTDLYLLYRNAKNLGYFEIGPKVQFLNKVNFTGDGNDNVDVLAAYNKTNFAGVLGFGANLIGNDGRFSGILGLRFEYGFTDVVNTDSKNLAPVIYTDAAKSTNPFFAGLVFELNWGIGYFGKAQCGARSKFIMF